VGGIGTLVNLGLLTGLVALALPVRHAVALAIAVAMGSNFVLGRRFGLALPRDRGLPRQLAAYAAASLPGALLNYVATLLTHARFPAASIQAAAVVGIAAGAAFNLVASRYLAFKAKHVRVRRPPG